MVEYGKLPAGVAIEQKIQLNSFSKASAHKSFTPRFIEKNLLKEFSER